MNLSKELPEQSMVYAELDALAQKIELDKTIDICIELLEDLKINSGDTRGQIDSKYSSSKVARRRQTINELLSNF